MENICDRSTLATLLGLSAGRVQQLAEAGMPKEGRGKYDAQKCTQWYINFRIEGASEPAGGRDVNDSRRRLYEAQTLKTQLETARIRRETVAAVMHVADMLALEAIVSDALDKSDPALPADLASMADAANIAHRINQESHAIRAAIAEGLTRYATGLKS